MHIFIAILSLLLLAATFYIHKGYNAIMAGGKEGETFIEAMERHCDQIDDNVAANIEYFDYWIKHYETCIAVTEAERVEYLHNYKEKMEYFLKLQDKQKQRRQWLNDLKRYLGK